MSVNLSASGGTLSANTATIARGSTESGSITVTPNGNNSVTVNMSSAPSSPLNYTGIETTVGESLVMFPQDPDQNQAPAIVGKIPAQLLRVGSSAATVDVSGYFSDPDNDTLTYTASTNNASVTTVGVSGSTVTITPSSAGRSTVTVTANDGSLTATQTIAVAVEVASGAGVCARTPKVRDEIVARAGLTDCVNVTTTHLASITAINLQLKGLTTLKEGDFDGLTNLSILWLQNNSISSLPTGIFAGLSNLSDLFLGGNPGAPFTLTLELERTDNTNLLAPGPATVRVKVAEGAPFNITVGLSVQGGTLSANTATITKGNTVSSAITVTQTGQSGTGVTLGAVTGKPSSVNGIQMDVGDSLTLFSTVSNFAPVSVGTIPAQVLTAGGNAGSVNVSSKFSDPDNDTLTYTASSSSTTVATVSVSGSTVTITPKTAGSATVTVTASDGSLTVTQTIAVTVATAASAKLCDRTSQVQSAILSKIAGINNCADVTPTHLNSITSGLQVNSLTTLKENDFDGLGNLTSLFFPSSQLTSLPSGVFDELSSLTSLTIYHSTQLTSLPSGVLDELSNLETLQFRFCGLTSLPSGVLDELSNLRGLDFTFNKLTTLPSGVFGNLSNLTGLNLSNNKLTSLPAGIFVGLSSLTSLNLNGNPGGDFTLTMELGRTDNKNLAAAGPATVKVKVAEGAPFDMTVSLSVTGGTLSATTATIAKGSAESGAITVTQSGTGATTVTLGTAPTAPSNYLNVKAAVGSSLVLFQTNRAPVAVGTISAQSLTAGGSAAVVDVSNKFSDADNDTLTYTATSSSTSIATVSVSSAQVTITPVAAGSATITVTASDGSLTATQTIAVTVSSVTSISIPDTKLAAVVRSALGLGANDAITQTKILGLTYLHVSSGKSISNLTGLEHATNLKTLGLESNQISDVTPLKNLTNLTTLLLTGNDISDVTPLKNLTKLTWLKLPGNDISDVDPLKNLTNLTWLNLSENDISDVDPLKNLTKLTMLDLDRNDISDVDPLKNLTKLTNLSLWKNDISDVDPLKSLTNLTTLSLNYNDISDVTPLKNLTNLDYLYIYSIGMSDATPLKDFTNLIELNLGDNNISDVTPLKSLTNLTGLLMEKNDISDVTPLKSLTNLTYLALNDNDITALPTGFFKGFSNLNGTNLRENPGTPFTLTLQLARTDNTDLTAASPATVKVKLAEGAPFDMSVTLSITGGTLSSTTATIAKGSTESSAITVTQSGAGATTVTLGTAPTVPSSYRGIQTAVGSSLVLFSSGAGPPVVMEQPSTTTLLPNYPNPFNPETWIPYQLSKSAKVTLTIYNIRGVAIRQLALGHKPAGVYYTRTRAAYWDGRNNLGEKVGAGLYFVKFSAGDYTATRKMLIRK